MCIYYIDIYRYLYTYIYIGLTLFTATFDHC